MDTNHLCNSWLATEYIICECGDNFPSEAALNAHREKDHGEKRTLPKVIIQKQRQLEDHVPNVVYSGSVVGSLLEKPLCLISTASDVKEEPIYEYYTVECEGGIEILDNSEEVGFEEVEEEITLFEPKEEVVEDSVAITISNLKVEHDYQRNEASDEVFCEQCGKSFASLRSRKVHVGRMHGAPRAREPRGRRNLKVAVCEQCGSSYASRAALRYHQRTHTDERPYHCPVCPKRFNMPLYLQVHIRTHTGERPYQCPLCPKAFNNKAALMRHDRVHTGEKPYLCAECGKSFSQSNSRKLHVRTVHRRLPAPYKSRARKMQALQRTAARAHVKLEPREASNTTDFATPKTKPIILRIVKTVES